jgi:hypothetical protein
MWELLDQALGSKLAQIVSERAHLILLDGIAECSATIRIPG